VSAIHDPIRIGVLYDFDQGDGGRYFEDGLRLGLSAAGTEERLGRAVELMPLLADGLPGGSAEAVVQAFEEMVDAGVAGVVGPSISDNGIVVRDVCDDAGVACINYTGGAITRSRRMFHYQVGSLEEEPHVLAAHLRDCGVHRISVLHDDTPVGINYHLWLERAVRADPGLEIVHHAAVSPLADGQAEDLAEDVAAATAVGPDALVYLGLGVAARAVALGVESVGWTGPVVANSALMFGYGRRDWRAGWEGWVYTDTLSDTNPARLALGEISRAHAGGPMGLAAYDIGRLVGLGLVLADEGDPRDTFGEGLERIKRVPAASGKAGTVMGFGQWDHAALKGDALVLRAWRDGRSVEL
jgi:ABC-type branched-subunit amino acid transport system substrate-binding protein